MPIPSLSKNPWTTVFLSNGEVGGRSRVSDDGVSLIVEVPEGGSISDLELDPMGQCVQWKTLGDKQDG